MMSQNSPLSRVVCFPCLGMRFTGPAGCNDAAKSYHYLEYLGQSVLKLKYFFSRKVAQIKPQKCQPCVWAHQRD